MAALARLKHTLPWLAVARAAWLLVAGISLGLLVLLAPINVRTIYRDWRFELTYPSVARFVTPASYAVYRLTLGYAVAAVSVLVGVAIAWRRADDRMAWLASVLLVSFPLVFGLGGYSDSWDFYPTPWRHIFRVAHDLLSLVGLQVLVLIVFLFPNGRLPLRWMRWVCSLFLAVTTALAALLALELWDNDALFALWMISFATVLCLGLAGQLYRYRRLSTPLERQQTKWVVIGLAALWATFLITVVLQYTTSKTPFAGGVTLFVDHLVWLSLTLLPVTLAFSVMRYRLWDIDLLIRRTLLYAVLSGALAGLYLGSIVVLQSGWNAATGRAQAPVVTVLSTLFIAAIAGPLRTGLQRAIDRRFNRRRYDAARTLEAFSATLRADAHADLDGLSAELVGVVQDTLEPEKVSLWLRS